MMYGLRAGEGQQRQRKQNREAKVAKPVAIGHSHLQRVSRERTRALARPTTLDR